MQYFTISITLLYATLYCMRYFTICDTLLYAVLYYILYAVVYYKQYFHISNTLRRETLSWRPNFTENIHISNCHASKFQMLKSYGNEKGRSKFVFSYKPHFRACPISYIQYLLHQVSSGPFEVTTYPSIYTPNVIRRHN